MANRFATDRARSRTRDAMAVTLLFSAFMMAGMRCSIPIFAVERMPHDIIIGLCHIPLLAQTSRVESTI